MESPREHLAVQAGPEPLEEILGEIGELVAGHHAENAGEGGYESLLPAQPDEEKHQYGYVERIPYLPVGEDHPDVVRERAVQRVDREGHVLVQVVQILKESHYA